MPEAQTKRLELCYVVQQPLGLLWRDFGQGGGQDIGGSYYAGSNHRHGRVRQVVATSCSSQLPLQTPGGCFRSRQGRLKVDHIHETPQTARS